MRRVLFLFFFILMLISSDCLYSQTTKSKELYLESIVRWREEMRGKSVSISSSFSLSDSFEQAFRQHSGNRDETFNVVYWDDRASFFERHVTSNDSAELENKYCIFEGRSFQAGPRLNRPVDAPKVQPFVGHDLLNIHFGFLLNEDRFAEFWNPSNWKLEKGTDERATLTFKHDGYHAKLAFSATPDARLVSYTINGKMAYPGEPQRFTTILQQVDFEYSDEQSQFPTTVLSKLHIGDQKKNVVSHSRVIKVGDMRQRPKSLKDLFPEISNGTSVGVADHPGIEFEWHDGEIVRKIDRKKVESLSGFRFTGAKWILPFVAIVLTVTAASFWWIRGKHT